MDPITTPRLTLRQMRAGDAAFVLALTNDPLFVQHIGDRGLRTTADAQHYIDTGPWTRDAARGFGLRPVVLRGSGEPIGVCGLLERDALPDPDIGFAFLPAYRAKGYAFEAATAVKRYAHEALGLARLLAIVSGENAASIRLLEKLGFGFDRMVRIAEGEPELKLFRVDLDA